LKGPFTRFFIDEIFSRRRQLISEQQLLFSILLGGVLALFGSNFGYQETSKDSVVNALLNYSAIAMGFSVTCVSLCLTLADPRFLKKLSLHEIEVDGQKRDAFSQLIFVFTWTSFLHSLCIFILILAILTTGENEKLFSEDFRFFERISFFVSSSLVLYALSQFMVSLITMFQLGKSYVIFLRDEDKE